MPKPARSLPSGFVAAVLLFGLGFPAGCSFTPLTPLRLHVEGLRDNPELANLASFAVVVSGGGLSPTVTSAGVGNRSLQCLKLDGQVSYPHTLAELTAGISLSIPLGTYRISIVGYSDGIQGNTSIGSLFSAIPSLRSYLIAQGDFNTVASHVARLPSTYVKASAIELVAACPPQASGLYATYTQNSFFGVLKKINGTWSTDSVGSVATNLGNFALDSSGFADFVYTLNLAGPTQLYYSSNRSGSYVETTISSAYDPSFPADIAIATNGTKYMVNVDPLATNKLQLRSKIGSGAFTLENSSLMAGVATLSDARIVAGPSNRLLVLTADATYIGVRVRDDQGVWSSTQTLLTAGSFSCSGGLRRPHGLIDGTGTAHIVYLCYSAATTGRVGYANNRSGTLATRDLSSISYSNFANLSLASDGTYLRVLYGTDGNVVQYQKGDLATGNFTQPVPSFSAVGGLIGGVAIASPSSTDTRALILNSGAGLAKITELALANEVWTEVGTVVSGSSSFALNERLIAR